MAKRKNNTKKYSNFGSLISHWFLQNLPFVFFLAFLAIVYIANAHYSDGKVREIQQLQSEVQTLKRQYNTLRSEIMFETRYSEVANELNQQNLRINRQPASVIVIEE